MLLNEDFTKKSGTLSAKGDSLRYTVSYAFHNADGSINKYCTVENGVLKISDGAPEDFTVVMTVTVTGKRYDSFQNFLSMLSTAGNRTPAFFLEPYEIVLFIERDSTTVEEGSDEESFSYLEDCAIVDSGRYTGNMGDSYVDKLSLNRYGNGSIDIAGKKWTHGLEAWIARWNFTREISWSYATYEIGNKYNALKGTVCIIKSYNTNNFDTTLYFYDADTDILLGSYRLTPNSMPININIDVSGVSYLKVYLKDNVAVKGGTSFGLVDFILYHENYDIEDDTCEDSQGLEYVSNGDGTCYVGGIGSCTDTDVAIPAISPAGDRVTSIGDHAFSDCDGLTSITIGNSVTSIGFFAFSDCDGLMSVTIGNSVTSIDDYVFSGCSRLRYITIPGSVTRIGYWPLVFECCASLTDVYFNGTMEQWNDVTAWWYCTIHCTDGDIPPSPFIP